VLVGGGGVLIGRARLLVRREGAFLSSADSAGRFLVIGFDLSARIFDLLAVTVSLLAYLIHLADIGAVVLRTYFFVAQPPASRSPSGCKW